MKAHILSALLMSVPSLAFCETTIVTNVTPYGVAVETLNTTKAQGKKGMFWEGFSLGGYDFYSSLTSQGRAGGFMLGKMTYKVSVEYRFTKSDQTPILSGKCKIGTEVQDSLFGLSNKTTSSGLFSCSVKDTAPTQFALEVLQPPIKETSMGGGGLSIITDQGDKQRFSTIKAKLLYNGMTYEAFPTSYDASRTISRIVDGYIITKDAKPVGRIDFGGNNRDKATITVPVNETDGREAVIFFASQILAMPEINAGYVRSTLNLQ